MRSIEVWIQNPSATVSKKLGVLKIDKDLFEEFSFREMETFNKNDEICDNRTTGKRINLELIPLGDNFEMRVTNNAKTIWTVVKKELR